MGVRATAVVAIAIAGVASPFPRVHAQRAHQNAVIDLWTQGKAAFGVYAPNENAQRRPPIYTREGAARLAGNPLYDFVFLNLEGSYDAAAVKAYAERLRAAGAAGRKALIVRIPSVETAGADTTKTRVQEVLSAGADGVTVPHVRGVDEAQQVLGFFRSAGANVWSPSNPAGEQIAMLMVEDPNALADAGRIADLKGLSVLACGIGSLRQALGGDAAGAEAGTQKVLAETKRTKLVNMLTANAQDVEKRVKEGFLALLMQGAGADEAIRIGRAAAGR